MGARFNWILHFGLPPRYNKDVRVIQLDIEPESMHQNKPAEVALVGDGKAIVAQLNQALAGRQWFHPEGSPWRQAIAKKSAENAAMIAPQIDDNSSPGGYYRLFRDVREWLPKNVVLCSEGATHDGYRRHPNAAREPAFLPERRQLRHDGRRASGSSSPPASCTPTARSSTSPATRRSASPAWRWRRCAATTCRPRSSS